MFSAESLVINLDRAFFEPTNDDDVIRDFVGGKAGSEWCKFTPERGFAEVDSFLSLDLTHF